VRLRHGACLTPQNLRNAVLVDIVKILGRYTYLIGKNMDSVETDRLLLRPFTAQDGPSLHMIIGEDPDMTWDATSRPLQRTEEILQSRIKHYEEYGFGVWAVIDKTSGEMVGQRHE